MSSSDLTCGSGDTNHLSELRILLMGCWDAGKSASGKTILGSEEFGAVRDAQCVMERGEVAGRKVTLVEAPGWQRNQTVRNSHESLRERIVLSVSRCPPGPHAVLLVLRSNYKSWKSERHVLEGYLTLLTERVWSHTVVLFTFGDFLGDRTIERCIEREECLRWLVGKCGNRYHVFNNTKSDECRVTELLEKIDAMVAGNRGRHLELGAGAGAGVGREVSVKSQEEAPAAFPSDETLDCDYGPDCHPTFEMLFGTEANRIKLNLLDEKGQEVWRPREVRFNGAGFVDKHREELIQRISSVMEVADGLKSQKIITDEMYSDVQARRTPQDRMRELYKRLDSLGRAAEEEFYDILEKKHSYLVNELKSGSGQA